MGGRGGGGNAQQHDGKRGRREINLKCFYPTSINVSLDTIIEMKSFIRGVLELVRSSYSVSATTTAAAAASAPVALGRWGIQYDQRIIDRKIVQANEDHCGCCVVDDTEKKKEREVAVVRYEKREEYLVPYVM